jgi:hypothetical protein
MLQSVNRRKQPTKKENQNEHLLDRSLDNLGLVHPSDSFGGDPANIPDHCHGNDSIVMDSQDIDSGRPNYRRMPRLEVISLPLGVSAIAAKPAPPLAGNGRLERNHYGTF